MMTAQEGINQDLDDILDQAEAIEGFRPVFSQWTTHNGVECRMYQMKDAAYSKLVTTESDIAVVDHFWVDSA